MLTFQSRDIKQFLSLVENFAVCQLNCIRSLLKIFWNLSATRCHYCISFLFLICSAMGLWRECNVFIWLHSTTSMSKTDSIKKHIHCTFLDNDQLCFWNILPTLVYIIYNVSIYHLHLKINYWGQLRIWPTIYTTLYCIRWITHNKDTMLKFNQFKQAT